MLHSETLPLKLAATRLSLLAALLRLYSLNFLSPALHILSCTTAAIQQAYTWPWLHLSPTFPHARKHPQKKQTSCLTHIVTCPVLAVSRPSVPLRSPASTSTFHPTVTCDRPAMWDSRYCPSLLPPSHPLPSLSSLSLQPLPRPSLLTPPPSTPQPHTENDQPSLVWFDRGKFYLTFEGKLFLH